ncbi:hypothetical protein V1509DRAFT_617901 [Lipomyces kononenkoae]
MNSLIFCLLLVHRDRAKKCTYVWECKMFVNIPNDAKFARIQQKVPVHICKPFVVAQVDLYAHGICAGPRGNDSCNRALQLSGISVTFGIQINCTHSISISVT